MPGLAFWRFVFWRTPTRASVDSPLERPQFETRRAFLLWLGVVRHEVTTTHFDVTTRIVWFGHARIWCAFDNFEFGIFGVHIEMKFGRKICPGIRAPNTGTQYEKTRKEGQRMDSQHDANKTILHSMR